jgi:uncharacterized protein (TIGR02678 family)
MRTTGTRLGDTLEAERAEAVRRLLARPLLTREADDDVFRLVASHREWLVEWFDRACGWPLHVDVHGGTARLVKRRRAPDATRPARRPTDQRPFDVTRYVLAMLVAAELVARPHTSIGDLADAVAVVAASDDALPGFDAADHRHRNAFVDVLRWLVDQGMVRVTAGDLERVGNAGGDAVLEADVGRLAQLPSSTTPPSRITASDTAGWIDALSDEPRYGDPHEPDADPERRNRWGRHQVLRGVLDDPAADMADLDDAAVRYLSTPAGRQVVADAAADAGMVLERHADVLVAVDASRQASDRTFAERASTVAQAVGVLLGELVEVDRRPRSVSVAHLEAVTARLLAADPGWARAYQDESGGRRLAREALDELIAFGLARAEGGRVHARPAAARFAVEVVDSRAAPGPADAPPALAAATATAAAAAATQDLLFEEGP